MKRIVILLALAATISVTAAGCYRHAAVVTTAVPQPVYADWSWHHHLFWGIVNLNDDTPLDVICPQGIARVETWMGPLQFILTAITAGIYAPTTVRVFCRADAQPVELRLEVDEALVARLREQYPNLERLLEAAIHKFRAEEAAIAASGGGPAAI